MTKPNKFNMADALDTEELNDALTEMYERLDVRKTNENIKNNVDTFVNSLINNYIAGVDLGEAAHMLSMVAKIEANSIISVYKQTQYLEHIVDTVMIRIDESGGGNLGQYMTLMQLQSQLVSMTQTLLYGIRQLPISLRAVTQQALNMYSIDIEAARIVQIESETEDTDKPKLVAMTTTDLITDIEEQMALVNAKNAEIDATQPEELPDSWRIPDDVLLATENVEDAQALHAKSQEALQMPGQPTYDDDEFAD